MVGRHADSGCEDRDEDERVRRRRGGERHADSGKADSRREQPEGAARVRPDSEQRLDE
jgi:hypothetical protein